MPPKPFNPPRPSTSNAATGSEPRGRPKGSTNNPATTTKRKSTSAIEKPSKASKTKTTSNPKSKSRDRDADTSRTSGFSRPRISNASTVLNISSGDEEEEEEEDEDIEMGSGSEAQGAEGEGEDDEDPFSSQPLPAARRKSYSKAQTNTAQTEGNVQGVGSKDGRQISIPPDLINVLMHGFFNHDNTRMSRDANAAVGRYIETFVREGLTRAEWAKRNGWADGGVGLDGDGGTGGRVGDEAYLEVEDLERLAPQLLLDF